MFFFKSKKIVVDAFTFDPTTHKLFPIRPAVYSIPEWWKQLPSTIDKKVSERLSIKSGTMKNCDGFKSLYKAGFMLSMWSDLVINVEEGAGNNVFDVAFANRLLSSIGSRDIVAHDAEQYGHNFPELFQTKVLSPWLMKQDSDLKWLWLEPTWNLIENNVDVKILPGIIDFKYQHQLNINILLKKSGTLFESIAGEPIAQLIPLTDKEVIIKNHLISKEEWASISNTANPQFKFFNGYKTAKNIARSMENPKKCPFH
jgi:hypothetical protein